MQLYSTILIQRQLYLSPTPCIYAVYIDDRKSACALSINMIKMIICLSQQLDVSTLRRLLLVPGLDTGDNIRKLGSSWKAVPDGRVQDFGLAEDGTAYCRRGRQRAGVVRPAASRGPAGRGRPCGLDAVAVRRKLRSARSGRAVVERRRQSGARAGLRGPHDAPARGRRPTRSRQPGPGPAHVGLRCRSRGPVQRRLGPDGHPFGLRVRSVLH